MPRPAPARGPFATRRPTLPTPPGARRYTDLRIKTLVARYHELFDELMPDWLPELLDKLCDRYAASSGGIGLGLYLCNQLVRALGGGEGLRVVHPSPGRDPDRGGGGGPGGSAARLRALRRWCA